MESEKVDGWLSAQETLTDNSKNILVSLRIARRGLLECVRGGRVEQVTVRHRDGGCGRGGGRGEVGIHIHRRASAITVWLPGWSCVSERSQPGLDLSLRNTRGKRRNALLRRSALCVAVLAIADGPFVVQNVRDLSAHRRERSKRKRHTVLLADLQRLLLDLACRLRMAEFPPCVLVM
jgi:hypothetical protein